MTRASTYALLEPKPNASLPKACKLLVSTPLQKVKREHRGRHPTAPCHCTLLLRAAAASCSVPLQQAPLAIVARTLTRLLSRKHAVLLDIRCSKSVRTQALDLFPRTRDVPPLLRPQACIRNVVPKLLLSLAQAVSCESPNITGAAAGLPRRATVLFVLRTNGRPAAMHACSAKAQCVPGGSPAKRRIRCCLHAPHETIFNAFNIQILFCKQLCLIRLRSAQRASASSGYIAAEET